LNHGLRQKGVPMEKKEFQGVVQFAIKREIESVSFYQMASKMAKHSGTKELFLDFSKQEEGHRKLLEDFDMDKVTHAKIQNIPNLKISEYLVETELKPDSSYADILRVAMKREEHSVKLYTDLGEPVQDETLKKLFAFLVQEETKHKYQLEKIYDDEILK
jgi:rubrerythrin